MTDLERIDGIRFQVRAGLVLSTADCQFLLAVIARLAKTLEYNSDLSLTENLEGWQEFLPPPPPDDPFERAKKTVERKAAAAKATLFGD